MKTILGTFFGQNIYIESNDDVDWSKLWEDWLKNEKENAVLDYQKTIYFKQLEEKSKQMEKTIWYKLFKNIIK